MLTRLDKTSFYRLYVTFMPGFGRAFIERYLRYNEIKYTDDMLEDLMRFLTKETF